MVVNSKIRKPIYLNIKTFLKKDININKNKDYLVKLIIDGKGKVPTRLKFGLNLGLKKNTTSQQIFVLMLMFQMKEFYLNREYLNGAILNKFNSSVVITNTNDI